MFKKYRKKVCRVIAAVLAAVILANQAGNNVHAMENTVSETPAGQQEQDAKSGDTDNTGAETSESSKDTDSGITENTESSTDMKDPAEVPATEEQNKESETVTKVPPETAEQVAEEETADIESVGTCRPNLGDMIMDGEAVKPERQLTLEKSGPKVIEVTDLASFIQAVSEVTAEDDLTSAYEFTKDSTELVNPFQNKKLIVRGGAGFDPCGAEIIIQGYDNLYILFYETEEETLAAYEFLQTIPDLTVEAESVLTVSGITPADENSDMYSLESGSAYAKMPVAGRNLTIAVIDSGYDTAGCGTERITDGTDVTGGENVQDENGHGTAMANIILNYASRNIQVMPVKVTDSGGRTSALKLYLGIKYAIEKCADIINISMNAYRASDASVVEAAIKEAREAGIYVVVSAGNAGDDTVNYSPANSEDAIVVSAINTDYTVMDYSNYGAAVDFASYGKVAVTGMNQAEVEASGTSVSAAIMSMQIAQIILLEEGLDYNTVMERLQGAVSDLGEKGRDDVFGYGALTPEMVNSIYDENVCVSAEIFSCDWKNMNDDELNGILARTNNINLNKFLKDLSAEDTKQLLRRNTAFSQAYEILENITTDPSTCQHKEYDRFYDYLMEQEYSTSWMTTGSANQSGYFYLQHNDAKRRVNTSYTGLSTSDANPAPSVTVSFEPGSAGIGISFDGTTKVGGAGGDLNNIYILTNVRVSGLGKHSYVKDGGTTNNGEHGGGYTNGFTNCTKNSTAHDNIGLQVALDSTGIKIAKKINDKGEVTAIFKTGHAVAKLSTGENGRKETGRKNKTCRQPGYINYECKADKCSGEWTVDIPAYGDHLWPGSVKYEDNNGVPSGLRYEQCQRNCGEPGWKINYAYKQQIFYRYMDVDGNYPGYTTHVNDYYPAGTYIGQCKHVDNGTTEFKTTGKDAFLSPANASQPEYIDIPRKRYNVFFDGNGATGGSTQPHLGVYCGKRFNLNGNGFVRRGYVYDDGWSAAPNGSRAYKNNDSVVNLSYTDGANVNLYAVWKPGIFKITLDNQGADRNSQGSASVYEKYMVGYYNNANASIPFMENRIIIPHKNIDDTTLIGGKRQMQFHGYYTGKNGIGDALVQKDGLLLARMAGMDEYTYFASDATVYANWINKYAVQFSDNLTPGDINIVGTEKNQLPQTKWKIKGENITVDYEAANITNSAFTQIYRLKGWSLTAEISSDDEIILSELKPSHTFTEDKDVTLYAQWDTSYNVTYVGNEQSEGMDYLDGVSSIRDGYMFTPNEKEEVAALENPDADYFLKTIEKATVDIKTGELKDAEGNNYMETLPYSFRGWSMVKDKSRQIEEKSYEIEKGSFPGQQVIIDAEEIAGQGKGEGLTIGNPVLDYGKFNTAHDMRNGLMGVTKGKAISEYTIEDVAKSYAAEVNKIPFVNMYAIWDQYPQILANDLYFPLMYAQNGMLTEEYLLNQAGATDEEIKSDENPVGSMKKGKDTKNQTSFTILDYQESDFLGAEGDLAMSIIYQAEDAVGNVTKKVVTVNLVDTTAKEFDAGSVRFISPEYADTLSENSIWRTGDHAVRLSQVLGNKKSGEEYTEVTALEKAFGAKSVRKPGSGTWDSLMQVWEFTHAQVLDVQAFVKSNGIEESQDGFLAKFGSCRIQ